MHFKYNDGGRAAAGHAGRASDCVVRAIAIATGKPYADVRADIAHLADNVFFDGSDPEHGVQKPLWRHYVASLGWTWVPTMGIGTGCKVHLRGDELPGGRLIVATSRHLVAVVDGVVNDTHDSTRGGTRCVYGYFHKEGAQ